MSATSDTLRQAADRLEQAERFPFGPPIEPGQQTQMCGEACVRLCSEDPDKARTMWKLIVGECQGADGPYMPQAAAVALIRAANTTNLVPDCTPPELT